MQKIFTCFSLFIFFITGCSNNHTTQNNQVKDSTDDNSFFPVTQFIKGQLREIDSLPVTPLKITTVNTHEDSVWLKKENIRSFAEPFLHPEIDSAFLNKFYEKKSFLDQTINSITLTYDLKNNSADPKTIAVYINPQTNKVTRIYIVKEIAGNTGRQTLQLTWYADHWCKITTISEKENMKPEVKEEKLIWDFTN